MAGHLGTRDTVNLYGWCQFTCALYQHEGGPCVCTAWLAPQHSRHSAMMRLPGRVQRRHKKRACLIWTALIAALLGYIIWVVVTTVKKRDNPSISLTLENDSYPFPNFSVCLLRGSGCDHEDLGICRDSVFDLELANRAIPLDGFIEDQDEVAGTKSDLFVDCIDFDVTPLIRTDVDDSGDYLLQPPRLTLAVNWVVNNSLADSLSSSSLYVGIYMYDADVGLTQESQKLTLPYTRIPYEVQTSTVVQSVVNVGLTETRYLKGGSQKLFSALSISQHNVELEEDVSWEASYIGGVDGLLVVQFVLNSLSHTLLEEIEPLSVAAIIGSIGGAWELLLLVWGFLFFTRGGEPDQTGRNFVKSAKFGRKAIVNGVKGAVTITSSVSARGPSMVGMSMRSENLPEWERPRTSFFDETALSQHVPGEEVLIRLFEDHGIIAVVNGVSLKEYLKFHHQAKFLKEGASEPALKQLLPRNTFVVTVPKDEDAISLAKIIAGRYRTDRHGGEASQSRRPVVKAKRARCTVVQSHALSASSYVAANDAIEDESDVDLREIPDASTFLVALDACARPPELPSPVQRGASGAEGSANGHRSGPAQVPRPEDRPQTPGNGITVSTSAT